MLLTSILATTPGANAEPAAPHVAIPYDMATDQFGISNREDAPTIDVYTEALDSSGQRWVPVFKDEVARDAIEE